MSTGSQVLPSQQYNYTVDESLETLIASVRGNKNCNSQRKEFNLCRANILGKFVDPVVCQDKAVSLITCYQNQKKQETPNCKSKFEAVFQCAKNNTGSFTSGCSNDLDAYLSC